MGAKESKRKLYARNDVNNKREEILAALNPSMLSSRARKTLAQGCRDEKQLISPVLSKHVSPTELTDPEEVG